MGRVTTQEIVEHLPAVLARIAAGESLEVTDAGRPVAQLLPVPLPPPELQTPEQRRQAWEKMQVLIQSLAHRLPPGHVVDDSRESIYKEREDAQL